MIFFIKEIDFTLWSACTAAYRYLFIRMAKKKIKIKKAGKRIENLKSKL